MKHGYHQVPLAKESRPITCMSTPIGPKQWKVLPMGITTASAIFQRMMDSVLAELDFADPYIDDTIVGSTGNTMEEAIQNHERDLRAVLEKFKKEKLIVDIKKARMFSTKVEFCGHVLTQGKRMPAPKKLLSIQKWELPKTVTALRAFLGLTNYYSSYVPKYATLSAPMTSKFQLNRQDGKKGSQKMLLWTEDEIKAFNELKEALAKSLCLFNMQVDKPFVLETDASRYAIGAVLQQEIDGKLVPIAFCSRKLSKAQRNWAPREQETYAIVMALRKWAGWIGYQPVVVRTDHRSLEHWTTEHVDTPSGPAARRARWHETLSKFDIQVVYTPGKDHLVSDTLSRWAYPANKALADISKHGSLESTQEMKEIISQEKKEENEAPEINIGVVRSHTGLPKMLDLFSGTGSVGQVFREHGFEVISLDQNKRDKPTICTDIMEWKYWKEYPSGYFHTIFAGVPCNEYSRALTVRPRQMEKADILVHKTLEIIEYFQPQKWYIENPQTGKLKDRNCLQKYPFVDVDYCQFSHWGYQKPTRIWGSNHLREINSVTCDFKTCTNLVQRRSEKPGSHRLKLGGYNMKPSTKQKGRIPKLLVEYLAGWKKIEEIKKEMEENPVQK